MEENDVRVNAAKLVEHALATMPPELAAQAKELTESEILRLVLSKTVRHVLRLLEITKGQHERCGVCRDSGQTCAHCIADATAITDLMNEALNLAVMSVAATQPGSRIAAQREREAEEGTE